MPSRTMVKVPHPAAQSHVHVGLPTINRADPDSTFADRPVGQQLQGRVQPVDEVVDARDDAVQHRLDA